MPVPSGTIKGSVVEGILFCIFRSDLRAAIKYCQNWFIIDDLKLAGDASTREAYTLIQLDRDAIWELSGRNSTPLSICKSVALYYSLCLLHFMTKSLDGQPLSSATQCTDLGVLRDSSFSYVQNITLQASRLV